MDNKRAKHQDIRPMDFLIVNLMPTKEVTETQLLRLLANTPLQINVEFLYMTSHESKNTTAEHLETFYKTFADVKHKYYDGLIIMVLQLKPWIMRKWIIGMNCAKSLIGQNLMSIQPCTCVGERKLGSITNMVLRRFC